MEATQRVYVGRCTLRSDRLVLTTHDLSKFLDVFLDAAEVEANDFSEPLDIAVLELCEADVRNGADTELSGELVALLNIALDKCNVWIFGRKLWEHLEETLARSTPGSVEVKNAQAASGFDPLLEIIVGVRGHNSKVCWSIRHGNEVSSSPVHSCSRS